MTALRVLTPALSVLALAMLAALPWGLPSQDRFFLPLLPVIAIHYWTLRQANALPEWAIFLAGVAVDILTHGPLGYWSLIYLIAYAFAVFGTPYASGGVWRRLILLAAALAGTTLAAWAAASIYFFEFADWRPYALGAALAGLCAGPLLAALRLVDFGRNERLNPRLVRGV